MNKFQTSLPIQYAQNYGKNQSSLAFQSNATGSGYDSQLSMGHEAAMLNGQQNGIHQNQTLQTGGNYLVQVPQTNFPNTV